VSTECLTNSVLVSLEGQVAQKEGVGRRVGAVTVLSGTTLSLVLGGGVVTRSGEVNICLTTIDQCTLLGLQSSSGISRVGKLDVTETLGSTTLTVRDDTSPSDLTEALELLQQPLVINVPAQVTNEQVLCAIVLSSLDLGLLCDRLGLFLSLTLLGWGSLFLGTEVARVGVGTISGAGGRGVGVGVGLLL
jgi:hypothetical protein